MAHRHELDSNMYDPITFYNENSLNLIVDERIGFDREYIILDKTKVQAGIADPDQLLSIFNTYELEQFILQALHADYITELEYNTLIADNTQLYSIMLMNNIHTLLYNQITYITKIPSITDLENNGLLDSIIRVIQQNPALLIDQPLVGQYTDEHLITILEESHFISFNNAELILSNPNDILNILGQDTIVLFERVKPYLSYLTDAKILLTQEAIDSQQELNGIFSANEIKIIIDKELELKYYVLKALTPDAIQTMFDSFKQDIIDIQVEILVETHFNILKQEMMQDNYDELIKTQVDSYLIANYNSIMQNAIDTSFTRFVDEFMANDLQVIIKNYFDTLADDFLSGVDNTLIIQAQVEAYLQTNFEVLTNEQVLQWIEQTKG